MSKIRISKTVQDEMDGTSLVQQPRVGYTAGQNAECDEAGRSLIEKIYAKSSRKDGSVMADLSFLEAQILFDYMAVWEIGAAADVADDPSCLGEINASRAVQRALLATFGPEVAK